jgi:hypothetical protein
LGSKGKKYVMLRKEHGKELKEGEMQGNTN